ncbi:MAG: FtsX-like permease family protein [Caldilineaceae bacterium SB0664_bin_27]|uniref:FtsX-like permease family protein n=1 Tax=Caldilineaceae bacterium SB0664_bin_27 TaxID=2605260 RepID=A0A6B0YN78_9CHLR|nr:FtsX-like permease family protein [Caldilineaceae bacterium SB0664_bin_27]
MRSIYSYLGLWRIALRRFSSEPVLTFCLLLGWSVVVALASAPPMYTDAANRSLLQHELQTVPNRSAFSFFYHYVKGSSIAGADWQEYLALNQYMETRYSQDLGLPHRSDMHYVKSDLFQVFPLRDGQYELRDKPLLRGYLGFINRLEDYITVVEGGFPAQENAESGNGEVVNVLVSQAFAVEAGLQVGEGYTLFDPSARTANGAILRLEVPVRIAGIWIPRAESSAKWHLPPASFANVFLVSEETYIGEIGERVPHALTDVGWYRVVDGDSVRAEDVDRFLRRVSFVDRQIQSLIGTTYLELSPVSALRRYQRVATAQAILLLLFSIPILGLVLYFIVLIADSTVKRQQIEISILKSRGATTGQVFSIYLLQGATLGIVALAIGPLLGQKVAQFIGGTRYFMTFNAQTPLQIETTTTSMTYTFAAIGGALFATVLPAMGAARLAIVEAKQEISRRQRRSFWERSYLDFLLLGVASYGYYMLRTQGRIAFLQADVPSDPLDNPLLFLAPALFILAVALVAVRLFPLIALVLSLLWARLGGISMLLAFYNLARTGRVYTSLLLLLILTTSLGTFTASMARTLDANLVARIFYEVGADVTLTEGAALRILPPEDGKPVEEGEEEFVWINMPVDEHRQAPGVRAATRIGDFPVSTRVGSRLVNGRLFGIDRSQFPEVAYFRPDFAADSLGKLMNALAVEYSGVIVSQSMMDALGLQVGDTIALSGLVPTSNATFDFQIVGAMGLFPTVYPEDGEFFVANLNYIFSLLGHEVPYRVWLATEEAVDPELLVSSLDDLGYRILAIEDAHSELAEAQARPARVGLFGFLSVGFIAVALLSMLALVIYSALSFRQRFIQLGILRAMGLSTSQLVFSLAGEQVTVTTAGIAAGSYLGLVSSYLFIPFYQVGYKQADLVPPFIVQIAWDDVAQLVLAMLIMVLAAAIGTLWLLVRMKTFQAVKMGEVLA